MRFDQTPPTTASGWSRSRRAAPRRPAPHRRNACGRCRRSWRGGSFEPVTPHYRPLSDVVLRLVREAAGRPPLCDPRLLDGRTERVGPLGERRASTLCRCQPSLSIAAIVLRANRARALICLFRASPSAVKSPCLKALRFPAGAPPLAPCIRQTSDLRTAGAWHRSPASLRSGVASRRQGVGQSIFPYFR